MKDQRKPDWARILAQYSIPIFVVIGAIFVGEYRLTQAEENMVQEDVHTEVHKSDDAQQLRVEIALEKLTEHAIETDRRIQQVNFDAQQAQQKALNTIIVKMHMLHAGNVPNVSDAGSGTTHTQ